MQFDKFDDKLIVRIDKGEEIVGSLIGLCDEQGVKLGSVSGIGATKKITLGLFDPDRKEYFSKTLEGNFEITSLSGNASTMAGKTYLHLHATVADEKQQVFGGHLNEALVSATCEVIIEILNGEIDREFSEEIGLNLLKF